MRAPLDPLGQVLVRSGALTEEMLADVLDQQRHPLSLGSLCYILGYIQEDVLARALSRQFGVPAVVLDRCAVRLSVLDGVSKSMLVRYGALPIYEDPTHIFIAAQDPRLVPDFLRELAALRGKTPVMHVALQVTLARTLRGCFSARERGDEMYYGPLADSRTAGRFGVMKAVSDIDAGSGESIGVAPVGRDQVEDATRELDALDLIVDTADDPSIIEDALGATSESLPPVAIGPDGEIRTLEGLSRFETDVGRDNSRAETYTEVHELDPRLRADHHADADANDYTEASVYTEDDYQAGFETVKTGADLAVSVPYFAETPVPQLLTPTPSFALGHGRGEEADAAAMRAQSGDKRVLVVDSDLATRQLVVKALQLMGIAVTTASTGHEAMHHVQAGPLDMVIACVPLPDFGDQVLSRAIASARTHRPIAVILMSSDVHGGTGIDDALASYEAEAYFDKPIDMSALTSRVRQLLRMAEKSASGGQDGSFERAIELYKAGSLDQAIAILRAGIEAAPASAKHHFVLANLLQKKSLIYEAIDEYETTIDLKPDYFPALSRLAYLYYKQGYSARAIEMWRRSLPHCTDKNLRNNIETFMRKLIADMRDQL